jgi:3-deoxy-D-manno-octulosonic-acid transferase
MLKRLTRSNAFLAGVGTLAANYLRLVGITTRTICEPVDLDERLRESTPFIAAMWHGQFLMIPVANPRDLPVKCMVARHGDAEIVGRALQKFGHDLIRGAGAGERTRRKDRGGVHALRAAIKTLAEGTTVAMTADVPPGPARKAGLGIVTLARMSGRPIIPVAVATSRFSTFNTWSRFTVNLPFGKMAKVVGAPIHVSADASPEEMETARQAVEDSLNAATVRAYELAGSDAAKATPVSAGGSIAPGVLLRTYRGLSRGICPLAGWFLRRRCDQGKEVRERLGERKGVASIARPEQRLLWFHAASVGETNAILPLMNTLARERPDLALLLTTVTVTSSHIAAARLPKGAIHQFVPLDTPTFVARFFDHWRPDLALFTESEIWPNLILEADRRHVPLALLNARMSERSYRRWLKMPGLARPLFSRFALILAQSEVLARRLMSLGARKVIAAGNIKFDSPPPPVEATQLAQMKELMCGRLVFLAASTHPGEDEIIIAAHKLLMADHPGLLTIIAPRHPDRGPSIAALAEGQGLAVRLRSKGEQPISEAQVYVADTIGELGLFYSLAPIAFIGGSLILHGGQNPLEAVKLGTGVLVGPYMDSFPEIYGTLIAKDGCCIVHSAEELAGAVRGYFSDPTRLDAMRMCAEAAIAPFCGAIDRTLSALEPLLPPKEAPATTMSGVAYAP